MRYRIYIFLLVMTLSSFAFSQQTMLSSLYFNNFYMINPAEAGRENATIINAGYRAQWMGYQGAPTITYLTAQHRLNKSVGLGGYVSMENMSFISQLNAEGTFSYKLKINDDNLLSAGLSLGVKQSNIDLSNVKADDYSDYLLMGSTTKGVLFNAKFGLTYEYKKNLRIGLSFPQLMNSQLQIANTDNGVYNYARHWNLYASYNLELDDNVDFIPVFMLRNAQMVEHQFDVLANFRFNKKYLLGMGVRQNVGFLINLGGQITNMIGLSYAYDFTGKSLQGSAGSHEIMLTFKFDKKEKEEEVKVKEEEVEEIISVPEE